METGLGKDDGPPPQHLLWGYQKTDLLDVTYRVTSPNPHLSCPSFSLDRSRPPKNTYCN